MPELLQSERLLIWAITGGLTLLGCVLWFAIRKFFFTQDDGARVIQRVSAVEARLDKHETRLDAMPTVEAINRLESQIGEVRGDLRAQGATLDGLRQQTQGINRGLEMLNRHLLEKG